jgi:hypothetical protein
MTEIRYGMHRISDRVYIFQGAWRGGLEGREMGYANPGQEYVVTQLKMTTDPLFLEDLFYR